MITANLATYPPRRETLLTAARKLSAQVDVLNVVLNEYDAIPPELAALSNVVPVIPDQDTKDTGKFYIKPDQGHVLMCDDDLGYPDDYVARTIDRFEALDLPRAIAGYHTSTYRLPRPWRGVGELRRLLAFRKRTIPAYRQIDIFYQALARHKIVDQVASGVCVMRASDMPPFSYMQDSQKFVDVRLTKWCFEQGITPVALPRAADWITPIRYEETIFEEFTKLFPRNVSDEIWTYAFRVKGRGKTPPLRQATK